MEFNKEQIREDIRETIYEENKIKKNANVKCVTYIKHSNNIDMSKATLERMHNCGVKKTYAVNVDHNKHKQIAGESCNNRFCPLCARRSSMKAAQEIYAISAYLIDRKAYKPIFITLTIPNVKPEDLDTAINKINKGTDRLFKRADYRRAIKAWVIKIEITHNRNANTYHPHVHILALTVKNYASLKENGPYIRHKQWVKDWQEVMEDDRITQVYVESVENDQQSVTDAVLEVSKYTAKDEDYLKNQETFEVFYNALYGKRTLRFNGEFTMLRKVYQMDKWGLFDKYSLEKPFYDYDQSMYLYYKFNEKDYKCTLTELTDKEKEEVNKRKEYESYDDFKNRWKHVVNEKINAKDKVDELKSDLDRRKKKLEKDKRNKAQQEFKISGLEAKLKTAKRKYYKYNAQCKVYNYVDNNMRDLFAIKN